MIISELNGMLNVRWLKSWNWLQNIAFIFFLLANYGPVARIFLLNFCMQADIFAPEKLIDMLIIICYGLLIFYCVIAK